jgi:hypothetical protein
MCVLLSNGEHTLSKQVKANAALWGGVCVYLRAITTSPNGCGDDSDDFADPGFRFRDACG